MLKEIKRKKYKEFYVFSTNEKNFKLGKKILDKKYIIKKELKNTKRNYVAVIEIDKKKYVLKEPRNEYRIPQRKFMSFFKKGEVLTTLENITNIYNNGFYDFVLPVVAINKRKNGMIIYSALLMEYYDGDIDIKYNNKLVEKVIKMHKYGVYHGDFNPGNFLIKNGEIKIIDTQCKKIRFGKYRSHYDMLTMKLDSYKEMIYPYRKDCWYYLALMIKKIKRLKFIEKIKSKKKELRDRGWKI